MRARQILSKNVRALIDAAKASNAGLSTIRKVAEASDGKLTNGTVGRIVAGSHPTDIEKLADLAEVFGVQPWQLLVENLNPKALPRLVDSSFLSQLKEIVETVPNEKQEVSPIPTDEQAVQHSTDGGDMGAALRDVFDRTGSRKNAGSKPSRAQKPKGRRGR